MGYCGGRQVLGSVNTVPGRSFGGRGGGRGWRHRFYATGLTGWQRAAMGWPRGGFGFPNPAPFDTPLITREQELSLLEADLRCLEQTAENLRRRIDEMKTEPAAKGAAQSTQPASRARTASL
jgi:hypothetical protein